MTAKHTPGPWHSDKHLNAGTHHFVWGPFGAEKRLVADCGRILKRSDAEMEANARLVAAAPDLLAALKALGAFIEALPLTGDIARLVCLKDAAIAKAEGR